MLLARQEGYAAVGLDWERVGRFDHSLWPSLFTPREMEELRRSPRSSQAATATVLFAAKEAIQKARYSATSGWSELTRLEVALDLSQQQFGLRDDPTLTGRFLVDEHSAVAACLIPHRPTTSAYREAARGT